MDALLLEARQIRAAFDWLRANNGGWLYLGMGRLLVDDGNRMYTAPLGMLVENVEQLKREKGRD